MNTQAEHQKEPNSPGNPPRSVGRLALGLALYVVLIAGYLFVLRLLGSPLLRLYQTRLGVYALVALGLIAAQGLVLESITTFLAEHLGIVTHEER